MQDGAPRRSRQIRRYQTFVCDSLKAKGRFFRLCSAVLLLPVFITGGCRDRCPQRIEACPNGVEHGKCVSGAVEGLHLAVVWGRAVGGHVRTSCRLETEQSECESGEGPYFLHRWFRKQESWVWHGCWVYGYSCSGARSKRR